MATSRQAKTKAKKSTDGVIPSPLKNRIVGYGQEDPAKLKANPENWRTHGPDQEATLGGLLDTVGWVQSVIKNKPPGIIDDQPRVAWRSNATRNASPWCM
jgi:hypothetical protein